MEMALHVASDNKFAERVELLGQTLGLKGVPEDRLEKLANLSIEKRFEKGEVIFDQSDPCDFFYVVSRGLVKVSICSSTGLKITYLLASRGEPLNLVGPFTGSARPLSAEALEKTCIVLIKREDFLSLAFDYPDVIVNIIDILGHAIDGANSRIIDMLEKRVEQRLIRVLYTLYKKFGITLKFTSYELAELAGTTTESTLRAMGRLRELGLIKSSRGEVCIIDPKQLEYLGSETFWI
jgi:CRP-like cAMP-binding protein